MKDFVLFAILGLGAGSVYAMLGLGLVLVYRGSGVVNFAHGAIAMFAAYEYVDLTGRGMGRWPALVVTLSLSLVAGAILYSALFRRLRRAPRLAQLVATLGVLLALQSGAPLLYGTDTKSPVALLPSDPVDVFGVRFGQDRLWLLGITVVLASMLWALYRFTRFGVATQAAAESEEGAVLLGYSPDAIGVANWGLGCALAAAAGILVSPITSLSATTFTLLIIPALAAALIGRFSSFSLVAVTGIGIGVVQSLVTGGQIGLPDFVPQQGLKETLPFLVIIVAMVVTGALIPNRGALGEGRPPFATSGRVRPVTVAVAVAAVIGLLVLFEGNNVYQSAIMVSMIAAIVALSLVVVTGFVGQISLAQMTFAGIGGFAAAKLTAALGVPILVSIVLAALIAVPIGLLIGLPALRVRGVNLAVLTIGAAVAIDNFVFQNSDWSGGIDGLNLPEPNLFGWSLSASAHPQRFGAFVAIVLTALALAVCALRRSPTGHRMLAVRDNERAAAASGVNVAATKLQAFAVAAAIASVAGTLTAYQYGRFASMRFFPVASIFFVAIAYIGGIASTSGALVAGTLASGGLAFTVLGELGDLAQWQGLISGVVLIIIVITQPDGISVAASRVPAAVPRGSMSHGLGRWRLPSWAGRRSREACDDAAPLDRRGLRRLRRRPCARPRHDDGRAGDARRADRPERRRQDHPRRRAHGLRARLERRHPLRGRAGHAHEPAPPRPPRPLPDVPVGRAVRGPHRPREPRRERRAGPLALDRDRRVAPAAAARERARRLVTRAARSHRARGSPPGRAVAGSAQARRRRRACCRATRSSCSSTSPARVSTPRRAGCWGDCCGGCSTTA